MSNIRRRHYDVIVVGARCAGASVAAFLARAGASVLLLDKDAMPSDQVLSTHNIHPAGMHVLDELGVGPAVRSLAPASRVARLNLEASFVDLELPGAAYCPRRERLDGLLQEAARAAGAELADRARVVSLVWEGDRTVGVRVVMDGRKRAITGGLIVGADGRWSTVARLTGSDEYLGYDAPRAVFWAYWNASGFWRTDPAYGFDMYFSHLRGEIRAIFQTDRDQLLLGSTAPADRIDEWRADPAGELRAALMADPVTAPLVRDREPEGKVRGAVKERYFFRRPVGDGWVLVGDAGVHKEYLLGDGITEALLQARSLAAEITVGTTAALVRWWRARDAAVLPLYVAGQSIAGAKPPLELMRFAILRLEACPELKSRLAAVLARELSPFEAVPLPEILRGLVDAAAGGRWGVFRELPAVARPAWALRRALRTREKILTRAEARMDSRGNSVPGALRHRKCLQVRLGGSNVIQSEEPVPESPLTR